MRLIAALIVSGILGTLSALAVDYAAAEAPPGTSPLVATWNAVCD